MNKRVVLEQDLLIPFLPEFPILYYQGCHQNQE